MEKTNGENKNLTSFYIIIAILSILSAVLLIVLIVFGNIKGVSKKELAREYIKKDEVSFTDLSYSIQQNYVTRTQYESDLASAKNTSSTNNESTTTKKVESTPVEKVEVKTVTKVVYDESTVDKERFKFLKCLDMGVGSFYLTPKCKQDIAKFAKENADKPLIEVIGVTDGFDFKIIEALEDSNVDLAKYKILPSDIDRYKKVTTEGLAYLRVNETIWELKQILGKSVQINPVSYNVKYNDGNRGTIIRAYYKK